MNPGSLWFWLLLPGVIIGGLFLAPFLIAAVMGAVMMMAGAFLAVFIAVMSAWEWMANLFRKPSTDAPKPKEKA